MSRQLPARPNLEHLRKQAKDLLQSGRVTHPSWQLADAQHALARGYGFSSWPALKSHVEALDVTESQAVAAVQEAAPAPVNSGTSALNGRWIADLERSQRHSAFQFRSATLEVQTAGNRVTMTQVVIDANGEPSGGSMTIAADGQPHGDPAGRQLVAQWLDAHTLEAVDVKDGREMGRGRYEVSPDGRELTVTTGEQRLVFGRA
jgi:hypothetical protein